MMLFKLIANLNLRTYIPPMNDDPHEISNQLIVQHGSANAALSAAAEGAVEAQKKKDMYGLSVWRDVKRVLRAQVDE
jgi:hypothetical protein